MSAEKRRYKRIRIRIPVRITLSDGSTIPVTSSNLSAGGIAVLYGVPADRGSRFEVSFTISAGGKPRHIPATVEVVHHHLSGEGGQYTIGMQYIRISEKDRQIVDHYVRSVDRIRS